MSRRPLDAAIAAVVWPWTDGRLSPWWFGSTVFSGIDEFVWSWNSEDYESIGLSA